MRFQEINRDESGELVDTAFPSDDYIEEALTGTNIVLSQDQIDRYTELVDQNNGSNEFVFDTLYELDKFVELNITPYFDKQSITRYSKYGRNGKYVVRLAKPRL